MKLENQVTSLELSKRLKELGVPQESLFWWVPPHTHKPAPGIKEQREWHVEYRSSFSEQYAAFTVAELGELLATELTDANELDSYTLKCGNAIDFWYVTYGDNDTNITPQIENPKLADAMAEMLIYLIENNLYHQE